VPLGLSESAYAPTFVSTPPEPEQFAELPVSPAGATQPIVAFVPVG
jgi:hypothetical protein